MNHENDLLLTQLCICKCNFVFLLLVLTLHNITALLCFSYAESDKHLRYLMEAYGGGLEMFLNCLLCNVCFKVCTTCVKVNELYIVRRFLFPPFVCADYEWENLFHTYYQIVFLNLYTISDKKVKKTVHYILKHNFTQKWTSKLDLELVLFGVRFQCVWCNHHLHDRWPILKYFCPVLFVRLRVTTIWKDWKYGLLAPCKEKMNNKNETLSTFYPSFMGLNLKYGTNREITPVVWVVLASSFAFWTLET